jgi:LysM repeat protein
VRRGDTLSGIAKRHGVRLNELLAWNSLDTRSVIVPGQSVAVRRAN